MCFGNQQVSTVTPEPNAAVSGAATSALGSAENLQAAGFTPYSGNQVAQFSPQQQGSFGLGQNVAGGIAPYVGETGGLINEYATAGPQSVSPNTISSAMSPYLNQYVNYALQPQLQGMQQQFAAQDQQLNAAATSSGAFGDARAGIQAANLTNQQNIAQQGLIGNAYNAAFNSAIGAGAQDVSNNLQGQMANAGYNEAALSRALGGANALSSQGTNAVNLTNQLGQQQTAQSQAQLNAAYNQWLMAEQYPFQTQQLLNQTVQAGAQAMPPTQVTSAPNNSGWGMLGAILGGVAGNAGKAAVSSDIRLKQDVVPLIQLDNGLKLYRFRYRGTDPTLYVGVMGHEAREIVPEAVHADEDGYLMVDYKRLGIPFLTWDECVAQVNKKAA
jgi:hypothetical protein